MQNYFLTPAQIEELHTHDDIVAAYDTETHHLGSIERAENPKDDFICRNCGVNTADIKEYYSLHTQVWLLANNGLFRGMQCLKCVELNLGRNLTHHDFTEAPINYRFPMSTKMFGIVASKHRAAITSSPLTNAEKTQKRAMLRKKVAFIIENPDSQIVS